MKTYQAISIYNNIMLFVPFKKNQKIPKTMPYCYLYKTNNGFILSKEKSDALPYGIIIHNTNFDKYKNIKKENLKFLNLKLTISEYKNFVKLSDRINFL